MVGIVSADLIEYYPDGGDTTHLEPTEDRSADGPLTRVHTRLVRTARAPKDSDSVRGLTAFAKSTLE
jgi:hypothetical protein